MAICLKRSQLDVFGSPQRDPTGHRLYSDGTQLSFQLCNTEKGSPYRSRQRQRRGGTLAVRANHTSKKRAAPGFRPMVSGWPTRNTCHRRSHFGSVLQIILEPNTERLPSLASRRDGRRTVNSLLTQPAIQTAGLATFGLWMRLSDRHRNLLTTTNSSGLTSTPDNRFSSSLQTDRPSLLGGVLSRWVGTTSDRSTGDFARLNFRDSHTRISHYPERRSNAGRRLASRGARSNQ